MRTEEDEEGGEEDGKGREVGLTTVHTYIVLKIGS